MGQSVLTHNFKVDLAWSEQASDEPFWAAVYRKAFPSMVNHMLGSGDTKSQRLGIDHVILLSSGKSLYIDEKKRREVYQDILLEYISVDNKREPGWIEKELAIDYLAYAFLPSKRVYLFDWQTLKRAWRVYGDEWKATCRRVEAQNNGYKTISVAVPITTLRQAVSICSIIQLQDKDLP